MRIDAEVETSSEASLNHDWCHLRRTGVTMNACDVDALRPFPMIDMLLDMELAWVSCINPSIGVFLQSWYEINAFGYIRVLPVTW